MARVILKYPLPLQPGTSPIHARAGAKVLCVKEQGSTPVLYLEVNTSNPECMLHLETVPTGGEVMSLTYPYIGTAMILTDYYVLHYYLEQRG